MATTGMRPHRTPSYRHHKPSCQAVVTLGGKDVYLGRYGSEESKREYDRLIVDWIKGGRQTPKPVISRTVTLQADANDITAAELALKYVQHAEGYYRKGDRPTSEVCLSKVAARSFVRRHGHQLAREFGPKDLKAIRETLIDQGIVRVQINRRLSRIVRMFKWAVENELVPASVWHTLKAVSGLRQGRSEAKEGKPVRPVADVVVDSIRPYVSRQVWSMIELQRLTGARPGEIINMRTGDIDTSGKVWVYVSQDHKTLHHAHRRTIYLGPQAQQIVREWFRPNLSEYLFSPKEAEDERYAEKRSARKSPMTPSQLARTRKAKPKRAPSDRYDACSYRRAIDRACYLLAIDERIKADGVDRATARRLVKEQGYLSWHPHRPTHNSLANFREISKSTKCLENQKTYSAERTH